MKKIIQKLYLNESGSTSVLIVVMMIVLTAFGMAALTTAYAGYRLSNKSVEFSQEFYTLEGEAISIEYEILEMATDTKLELELIFEKDQELFETNYYEAMILKLKEYAKNHEGMTIESSGLITEGSIAHVNYVVSEGIEKSKSIGVKLDIQVPIVSNISTEQPLVNVINRYEWQEGVGIVNDDIFFEDLFDELDQPMQEGDNNPFE